MRYLLHFGHFLLFNCLLDLLYGFFVLPRGYALPALEGGGEIEGIAEATARGNLTDRERGLKAQKLLGPLDTHGSQVVDEGTSHRLGRQAGIMIGLPVT